MRGNVGNYAGAKPRLGQAQNYQEEGLVVGVEWMDGYLIEEAQDSKRKGFW